MEKVETGTREVPISSTGILRSDVRWEVDTILDYLSEELGELAMTMSISLLNVVNEMDVVSN